MLEHVYKSSEVLQNSARMPASISIVEDSQPHNTLAIVIYTIALCGIAGSEVKELLSEVDLQTPLHFTPTSGTNQKNGMIISVCLTCMTLAAIVNHDAHHTAKAEARPIFQQRLRLIEGIVPSPLTPYQPPYLD